MPKTSQRKKELIAQIVGDAYYPRADKKNVMSSMIWALVKGTQWEQDGKEVIEGCDPKFFTLK